MPPIPSIKHFEYLVLGGGSGGIASARRAAEFGVKVGFIYLIFVCLHLTSKIPPYIWYPPPKCPSPFIFDINPTQQRERNTMLID